MMDTPLPDENGILLEMYGNEQFSRDVVRRFAGLRGELEEGANQLHCQIGTLARAVRSAMQLGDTELPLQVCAFLDEALCQPRAISEIENAVAVSFVEADELRASGPGKTVLRRMPGRVSQILLDQEGRKGRLPSRERWPYAAPARIENPMPSSRKDGFGSQMIATEVRADIGVLLDELGRLGYRVIDSRYSPECFGNWVVELTGPRAFSIFKDRSQFMVAADRQSLERVDLWRAFNDREEFESRVLAWAAGQQAAPPAEPRDDPW